MNGSIKVSIRDLNDCGCCEGLSAKTPIEIDNRPSLSAIAYRIGTHPDFKASMLAKLSAAKKLPMLKGLRTRDDEDFSIALLDAWAIVADVLTFYNQYIANESYLRTATERLSILELARLIGYRPSPGVAASAFLAFTVDALPGSPAKVRIDVGTKVQSTPAQDEQAQVFETVETTEARLAWNSIRPKLMKPQVPAAGTKQLTFEGVTTGLSPGDGILFTPSGGSGNVFGVISAIELDQGRDLTQVTISPLPTSSIQGTIATNLAIAEVFPPPLNQYVGKTMDAEDLEAEAQINRFQVQEIFDTLAVKPPPLQRVLVFRRRASIFGHSAPDWNSLPEALKGDVPFVFPTKDGPYKYDEHVWPGGKNGNLEKMNSDKCPKGSAPPQVLDDFVFSASPSNAGPAFAATEAPGIVSASDLSAGPSITNDGPSAKVFLDNIYPEISAGSRVILRDGTDWGIYQVQGTTELSKACFMISAKVTRLDLDSAEKFEQFCIRSTTVYGQSEWLPLARVPVEEPVPADNAQILELDGWVDGLQEGQCVVLSGRGIGGGEQPIAEFVVLNKVEHILTRDGGTRITFTPALKHRYARESVAINANVALANHGETVEEVLGSGDATQPYQQFTLLQGPLTHIVAATPSGTESTLKIRVNDILWKEAPAFFGRRPNDRIFVTARNDADQTGVEFGNGETGALLPTGQNNIRAVYRKGIGTEGLVDAGQLNILMSRPLGLKEVTNPHPATGAADPESRDEAQRNAPLTVLTLDRTVSLQDYEDFASAFAGIAKALAVWAWNGYERSVFITVAGAGGNPVEAGSPLYEKLLAALKASGDPFARFRVQSYRAATFRFAGKIKVDPDFQAEKVLAEVEAALRSAFSFEARAFGQPVALSEVIAVIQPIPGVIAVDVDFLYRGNIPKLEARLPAALPVSSTIGQVQAAELLTLRPGPLDHLGVMS